jgi:hypothetical protein
MSKAGKKVKQIIQFFCGPCAKYHLTNPHYRAIKRREALRREAKEAKAAEAQP